MAAAAIAPKANGVSGCELPERWLAAGVLSRTWGVVLSALVRTAVAGPGGFTTAGVVSLVSPPENGLALVIDVPLSPAPTRSVPAPLEPPPLSGDPTEG